jgi:recombination protein RecA
LKKKLDTVEELDKDKLVLDATIKSCEKDFGKGCVINMGNLDFCFDPTTTIPSSSIRLNRALHIGGLPKGRITEIYGPESSGKTSCALDFIANAQKLGLKTLYIDMEHSLNKDWATILGVKVDELLLSQPDDGEQAMQIADKFIRSGAVGCVVVDSVSALVTKAELEGEITDNHMSQQARLMSQSMRILNPVIAKSNTIVIFINQTRSKLGVVWGSPVTTSGGNALKFYASIRIELAQANKIMEGDNRVGFLMRSKITKNKLASPYAVCEVPLFFGKGFSVMDEVIEECLDMGIIESNKGFFKYDGNSIAHGRNNLKAYLTNNPDVYSNWLELVTNAGVKCVGEAEIVDEHTGEVS